MEIDKVECKFRFYHLLQCSLDTSASSTSTSSEPSTPVQETPGPESPSPLTKISAGTVHLIFQQMTNYIVFSKTLNSRKINKSKHHIIIKNLPGWSYS